MKEPAVIALSQICEYFRVDIEFVRDLSEFGLFPIVAYKEEFALEAENLEKLREIITLHEALGVNKEGIEIILRLRERIAGLQEEIAALRDEATRLKAGGETEGLETLKERGLLIEIDF
jgi:chaperone modulatory protein CbpM